MPIFLAVTALAFIVALIVWLIVWALRTHRQRNAIKEIDRKGLRTYKKAEEDYTEAKAKLGKNDTRYVIDFVHDISERFEASNPSRYYIEFEQAFRIMNEMRQVEGPVAIVLHTFGGYSLAAELVASVLNAHKHDTVAYVPYAAMSGGTVIALAAAKIRLGKNGSLGPIDPQYSGFSASSFDMLRRQKSVDNTDDFTLLKAYEFEKDQAAFITHARKLIHKSHQRRSAAWIDELASGKRSHQDRIGIEEAKGWGLNVEDGCPAEVYDLVDAKLQMLRKRESESLRLEKQERSSSNIFGRLIRFDA